MGEDFDFGSLDETTPPKQPGVTMEDVERMIELAKKSMLSQVKKITKPEQSSGVDPKALENLEKSLEYKMKLWQNGIIDNNNSQMLKFHDAIKNELSMFRESLEELWAEVYPIVTKMWGSARGIGKKFAQIDQLIRRK